jgi:hypothetical protein
MTVSAAALVAAAPIAAVQPRCNSSATWPGGYSHFSVGGELGAASSAKATMRIAPAPYLALASPDQNHTHVTWALDNRLGNNTSWIEGGIGLFGERASQCQPNGCNDPAHPVIWSFYGTPSSGDWRFEDNALPDEDHTFEIRREPGDFYRLFIDGDESKLTQGNWRSIPGAHALFAYGESDNYLLFWEGNCDALDWQATNISPAMTTRGFDYPYESCLGGSTFGTRAGGWYPYAGHYYSSVCSGIQPPPEDLSPPETPPP